MVDPEVVLGVVVVPLYVIGLLRPSVSPKARSRVNDLIAALQDPDKLVVASAAWALGQIGEAAAVAVPALLELAQRKEIDEMVKAVVNEALEKIQRKPKK